MSRWFIVLGALNALLAVGLGAFGAHGLKQRIPAELMTVYQTGIEYHMAHALGLLLVGLLARQWSSSALIGWAGWSMLAGILLFSGSLYLLAITGVRTWGAVTPFGGTLFLIAWLLVVIAGLRNP